MLEIGRTNPPIRSDLEGYSDELAEDSSAALELTPGSQLELERGKCVSKEEVIEAR
jgi:hypothetical protein